MTDRRGFLKLLSMGVIGHTLDIDKLLWVPGAKTIFLPSVSPDSFTAYYSASYIISQEMGRMCGKIEGLFDSDDMLYNHITYGGVERISSRDMRIPLRYKK